MTDEHAERLGEAIVAAVMKARAEERERCARVADEREERARADARKAGLGSDSYALGEEAASIAIAAAIRALDSEGDA